MTLYGDLESFLTYQMQLRSLRRAERNKEKTSEHAKENGERQEPSNTLENILGGKARELGNILGQIERDIVARMQVSERVSLDIDTQYSYLKTKFFAMYLWAVGVSNRVTENRRSGLEKLLNDLNKEKRMEQVECWKDIAKLREESRRWLKQYGDLRQRASVIVGGQRRVGQALPWERH